MYCLTHLNLLEAYDLHFGTHWCILLINEKTNFPEAQCDSLFAPWHSVMLVMTLLPVSWFRVCICLLDCEISEGWAKWVCYPWGKAQGLPRITALSGLEQMELPKNTKLVCKDGTRAHIFWDITKQCFLVRFLERRRINLTPGTEIKRI